MTKSSAAMEPAVIQPTHLGPLTLERKRGPVLVKEMREDVPLRDVPQYQAYRSRQVPATYDDVVSLIGAANRYRVHSGPYRGMKYFGHGDIPVTDKCPAAKLTGSYESELDPWIESLIETGFPRVYHVGCGEGYHAVGMALRMPNAQTVVFDTSIPARRACRALAVQNDVRSRLQLRDSFIRESRYDMRLAGSLVMADCGGAELTVLDPELFPGLLRATILVETHDPVDARITSTLVKRFAATHQIDFAAPRPRAGSDYAVLRDLSAGEAEMALSESRTVSAFGRPGSWALFRP